MKTDVLKKCTPKRSYSWNHKRIYRIYRELELNYHIKPKHRIKRDKPETLSIPDAINQVWSMGFISDSLIDGCSRDDDTCKY